MIISSGKSHGELNGAPLRIFGETYILPFSGGSGEASLRDFGRGETIPSSRASREAPGRDVEGRW